MSAITVISESELAKVISNWTSDFPQKFPDTFKKILYDLGLDVNQPWETQEDMLHRNRFNNVVQCNRYVGLERLDDLWIRSGYASREARNNHSGSKLLRDLDRFKYETI